MVRPERRTKGDVLAAAAIAVVVVVAAALIWWTSDARTTISRPAAVPAPAPAARPTDATRAPVRPFGATPETPTCAGCPGSTTWPSRSTRTTADAGRSARSTGPRVGADPPAAATPIPGGA